MQDTTSVATADRFMRTLQQAEQTKDVEPLVRLFADDAELSAPGAAGRAERGREGARRFWREYLTAFAEVRSAFTSVHADGDFAALEWESAGTLSGSDEPLKYRGVSLLEFRGDEVRAFRTYYDSAAFLPQGSKHAQA